MARNTGVFSVSGIPSLGIRLARIFLLSLIALVWTPVFAAEMYQWRDAEGHLHFGDAQAARAAGAEVTAVNPSEPSVYTQVQPQSGVINSRSSSEVRQMREQRAAAIAREQLREQQRQQRCAKLRGQYDRISHNLSSSVDKLRQRRDQLNRLRDEMNQVCR